ncbi:MAG: rhomboid family intramembrane serine protease, partial [Microcystaceae cyanobacterium]
MGKPTFSQTVKSQAQIIGSFVAIFWIVEILDVFVFQHQLDRYGIQPHSLVGLRGILFAPFLHGGFGHLIA